MSIHEYRKKNSENKNLTMEEINVFLGHDSERVNANTEVNENAQKPVMHEQGFVLQDN